MSGGLVVVLVLVVSSIAAEYHKRVYILKATHYSVMAHERRTRRGFLYSYFPIMKAFSPRRHIFVFGFGMYKLFSLQIQVASSSKLRFLVYCFLVSLFACSSCCSSCNRTNSANCCLSCSRNSEGLAG
jgi:hypothetical protein